MKWFVVAFIMAWINVPWWLWVIGSICAVVDLVIAAWKEEHKAQKNTIYHKSWQ